ncbi:hypothetical protein BP00DRAFT_482070 [Aspergillus indologenus CBS 114.80]|uniref:Uncharacterized protein n=1 Tax=Aspergillus indologenus CBS 114.80 TaxID=1450541 RepID=A0A2V5HYY8_9EURO|nr:hypothetical protein BP00DRAFT_482070 [Aspergillus indologenus CBS 114.80]
MAQVNPSPTSLVQMDTLVDVFTMQFRDLEQNPHLGDTRFVVVGDVAEMPYKIRKAHRSCEYNVETSGTIVLLIDYEDRIESIKNFLKERGPMHFQVIDNQLHYDPKATGFVMVPLHLIPLDRLGLGKDFDRQCGLKKIAEVGKRAPRIPGDAITEQLRTAVSRYGVTWSAERITAELQASHVRRLEESQGSQGQESGLDETPSLDNSEDSRDVAGLCSCLPWLARLWP